MQRCYYAPTFLDESLSFPDRRGNQHKTGRLSGVVFARRFFISKAGKVRSERELISFAWKEDTQDAKAAALAKVIEKMDGELPGLDDNPPTNWIPEFIKQELHNASMATYQMGRRT